MRPPGIGVLKFEVVDEIDGPMAAALARAVAEWPDYEIMMAVDTRGGDWVASRSIFTTLKNHSRRVVARIEKAASGGALIMMGADHRVMEPHGHVFLHPPAGAYPRATLDRIADQKAELIASRCRVPATRIRQWMNSTTTIGAERALAYGLIDEVPGHRKPDLPMVFL